MARRTSPLKVKQRAADIREYKRKYDPPAALLVPVEVASARQFTKDREPKFFTPKRRVYVNELARRARMERAGMHDALAAREALLPLDSVACHRPRRKACKRLLRCP